MTAHFNPALLLNADFRPLSYAPLSKLDWKDAIEGVYVNGTHEAVAFYDDIVRSPSREFLLPSVVALKTYVNVEKRAAFTRYNVYLRDRWTCQYCSGRFEAADLTYDHVIPRSRGGASSWENIVASCRPCNFRKANRTPAEAAMPLLAEPIKPSPYKLAAAGASLPQGFLHETWVDYLYWDTPLEA